MEGCLDKLFVYYYLFLIKYMLEVNKIRLKWVLIIDLRIKLEKGMLLNE